MIENKTNWLKLDKKKIPQDEWMASAIALSLSDQEFVINIIPALGLVGHPVEPEAIEQARDCIRQAIREKAIELGYTSLEEFEK